MRKTALSLAALAIGMMGCASHHEEGVKSDYMKQWTMVTANTGDTTKAAESVLKDRKLMNVMSSSTMEDGVASANMADGTKVMVDVKKKDAMMSEVSVKIGTMGDPKTGASIAKDIKMKAEMK